MELPARGTWKLGVQHKMERLDRGFTWLGNLKNSDQWSADEGDKTWEGAQAGRPPFTTAVHLRFLAIDPLQRIIEVAANRGILNPVLPRAANLRCALYADDVAIFASPSNLEIDHLHRILSFFGECSGLKINISKTEIYPIRLDTNTVVQLLQNFPSKVATSLANTSASLSMCGN